MVPQQHAGQFADFARDALPDRGGPANVQRLWWPSNAQTIVSHTRSAGGQPHGELPADHLDRVWPDAGPSGIV